MCRVILASTKDRAGGFSGIGGRSSNPFCGEFKFIDDIEGEIVVNIRGLINESMIWSAESDDLL